MLTGRWYLLSVVLEYLCDALHDCTVVLDFHDDFDEFMDRDSDVAAASSTSHNITDWEVGVAHSLLHNALY